MEPMNKKTLSRINKFHEALIPSSFLKSHNSRETILKNLFYTDDDNWTAWGESTATVSVLGLKGEALEARPVFFNSPNVINIQVLTENEEAKTLQSKCG